MRETSKCYFRRTRDGHFAHYLKGDGIDIGAGEDALIVPDGTVRAWDKKDGDAQEMKGVADESLDFVYASHCLEHMHDISAALTNWIRILKSSGHLYIVVPDYTLYEHHTWPSKWNGDHKHSFSMNVTREQVRRDNHWHTTTDLLPLTESLGASFIRAELEHSGFDFNAGPIDQTQGPALAQICIIARKR